MEQQHLELFHRLPGKEARSELVDLYRPLAVELARRYAHRGLELEDLIQVAMLGLLNALDRFDTEYGSPFVAFAVPTITGELKRHFRDLGWSLSVPRRMKEIGLLSHRANDELAQRLGRSPSIEEVAEYIGSSVEEVTETLTLGSAHRAGSLEERGARGEWRHLDRLGHVDANLELAPDLMSLRPLLEGRPDREREVLYLHFWQDMTQRQIAQVMGTSQMYVSRLLDSTLKRMRVMLSV